MAKARAGKGNYGEVRLPVARRYLVPERRLWLVLSGLAAGAVVLLGLALLFWAGRPQAIASGPLSVHHALLADDCAACHTGGEAEGCPVCHEPVGAANPTRSLAAHAGAHGGEPASEREEPECAECHPEHRGREAAITAVAEGRCLACHPIGSFARHPEFAVLREGAADDDRLSFAHGPHLERLLQDRSFEDPQRVCFECHLPTADGAGFEPLDFDLACGGCHLGRASGTSPLPLAAPGIAGVETLEAIRARQTPGAGWAFETSPEEFRLQGGKLSKRPVRHRDPWLLYNLARVRRELAPEAALGELVDARPGEKREELEAAYLEAIARLRRRARDLEGRSGRAIAGELREVRRQLEIAEQRVRGGEEALAAAPFAGPAAPERRRELVELAEMLTAPCRSCHAVEGAAILKVQRDQRVLLDARFDHRAHLVGRAFCLDCHQRIPGLLETGASGPHPLDVAATHNLPGIETCRSCHGPGRAPDSCVSCHDYHPEPAAWAELAVYAPSGGGG